MCGLQESAWYNFPQSLMSKVEELPTLLTNNALIPTLLHENFSLKLKPRPLYFERQLFEVNKRALNSGSRMVSKN